MPWQHSLSIYTCIMVCIFVLFLSMRWWEALQILSRRETSIGLPEAMSWCGLLRCCWQTKLRRAPHCLSFHWPAPFLEAYISTQRSCINRLEYRHIPQTDRQTYHEQTDRQTLTTGIHDIKNPTPRYSRVYYWVKAGHRS